MKNFANFIKGLSKIVFSRTLIVVLMILVQVAVFPLLHIYLRQYRPLAYELMTILGGILVIVIVNQDEPAEFKLTWIVPICLFPVFGALLYLFVKSNWGMIGLKRKVEKGFKDTEGLLYTSEETNTLLSQEKADFRHFAYYMEHTNSYPVYHNTRVKYFSLGEYKIEDLKEELRNAKKYIFIEYFIIDPGRVWDEILEILRQKVTEGVEVRVMYDGTCSLMLLPYKYPQKLKQYGIEAKSFAPVVPFFSTNQNNRDHRKIVVIDGRIAYTGGVNLADEYANRKVVFGHWKDVGIKLEGRAVETFIQMFLQNWNLYGTEDTDYEKYLNMSEDYYSNTDFKEDGFVIPYGDTPTRKREIGKRVYESIFNNSQKYIHIMMPYFIVDREFLSIMEYSALRGVEVKLILPHIPDKRVAFDIARTFYPDLLNAGVKIYEYTPGFVHAKVMVSDDLAATIGSVNLDYRSFYHHFECGAYLYNKPVVREIEEDFEQTLLKCQEIHIEDYKKIFVGDRMLGRLMRIVAPLL